MALRRDHKLAPRPHRSDSTEKGDHGGEDADVSRDVLWREYLLAHEAADTVQNDLIGIRITRNKDEAAFSTHVEQTKTRLDAIDAQVQVTQASLTARNDDLSTIQTRLQGLDTAVWTLQERSMLSEQLEELMKEVGAAKDMLQETCALQEKTRAQMSEELEAVRALRAEAAAAVAGSKAASAAVQSAFTTPTLKRKLEEEPGEECPGLDATAALQSSPSKRRRTMRVVSAIAQTATVASLGAAAAWGALAFS